MSDTWAARTEAVAYLALIGILDKTCENAEVKIWICGCSGCYRNSLSRRCCVWTNQTQSWWKCWRIIHMYVFCESALAWCACLWARYSQRYRFFYICVDCYQSWSRIDCSVTICSYLATWKVIITLTDQVHVQLDIFCSSILIEADIFIIKCKCRCGWLNEYKIIIPPGSCFTA